VVRGGGGSPDHVDAELFGELLELYGLHSRNCCLGSPGMKAIRIHEDGGPEVLRYEDAPDPEPGPGEVLVLLRAASLNHLDLWVRKGMPSVPKPRILGADGAGIRVDTGEAVVINPGLEHGAEAVVNQATGDVAGAVKEATGGVGADVVVEHVGEATWKTSLQAVRTGGRIAVCGATSGPNPPAMLHRIWWKQLTILGSTMGTRADFEGAYELIATGRARPVVDEVLPLEQIQAAHARLEAGEQLGKIVLAMR